MPKSTNQLALARQWEMLKLIPSHGPGITASEMRVQLENNGYTVTKRTVERDLISLSAQFGLRRNEKSIPHGWQWVPELRHEFGSIELKDAVSLVMAEDLLKQTLPNEMLTTLEPKFKQARSKLKAIGKNPLSKWTEKLRYIPNTLSTQPPTIIPGVLKTVQDALMTEKQIEVTYAPFQQKDKTYRLHPLSIIQRGITPYLVATAFDYPDPRIFALQRISKATATDEAISIPKNYSVDNYINSGAMDFGTGNPITLKANLSNELASYLTETPLAEDQKIDYMNNQLTVTVHDTWQLYFWILSQAAGIKINSPKKLKNTIYNNLKNAMGRYE